MFRQCDFFKRITDGSRIMPYCSYGVYHNELYNIHESEYPISENRSPHCPFSSCPHVGDIVEIGENLDRLLYK